MSAEEEIKKIEEEIAKTPYNKATQKHIGMLKAKLARLKAGAEKAGKKGAGYSYAVKKAGDATVLLVGFPSVGKSTFINKITNAESKVAEYDFTTIDVVPGVLEYNGAKIQVLDIPGIIEGVAGGRGRGKEILSVVRNADLILIMVTADKAEQQLAVIKKELYGAGFRLNEKPPEVKIIKKNTGGIKVSSTVKLKDINENIIRSVLNEFNILNAEVIIRENIGLDRFIDALMENKIYVPAIILLNKIDVVKPKKLNMPEGYLPISALKDINLEAVKQKIWEKLNFMRVYLKKIGKNPDLKEPLIMNAGCTIEYVCKKIHNRFIKDFRYARVWGSSKFPGQKVGIDYKLKDKDIVELHL